MLLEKPQNKAVERVLTDSYDAGRDVIIKLLTEYHKAFPRKGIGSFLKWYSEHEDTFKIAFIVGEKND